ncbi:hypothetical protein [Enterovibrio coralii]|uniref:hypothetical protein n=1 Tax=Enterovibrio coralii TaxID=294935 RepID=UPI000AD9D4D3
MKTVLHITEAFGGGIQTALCSYARSTAGDPIRHLLLARKRLRTISDLRLMICSVKYKRSKAAC